MMISVLEVKFLVRVMFRTECESELLVGVLFRAECEAHLRLVWWSGFWVMPGRRFRMPHH